MIVSVSICQQWLRYKLFSSLYEACINLSPTAPSRPLFVGMHEFGLENDLRAFMSYKMLKTVAFSALNKVWEHLRDWFLTHIPADLKRKGQEISCSSLIPDHHQCTRQDWVSKSKLWVGLERVCKVFQPSQVGKSLLSGGSCTRYCPWHSLSLAEGSKR